ncbi:MAG: signal peptidase I [Candidatus Woesearchaeota archaeon]
MSSNSTWHSVKRYLKKFWNFLWNEDSILSWIVNIALAFLIIKFLVYPGIGLALGTDLPVVAVISESMEHDGNFEEWWNSPAVCDNNDTVKSCTQGDWYADNGITKDEFTSFDMHNGFNKGDIIVLKGTTFEKAEIGEVLVYQSKLTYPVIHRITGKNDVIETKGDHNPKQIYDSKINEKYITKDQIIGKAWLRIPYLGYVKIWFAQLLQYITQHIQLVLAQIR